MKLYNLFKISTLIAVIAFTVSCKKDPKIEDQIGSFTIELEHLFGESEFSYSTNYETTNNDSISFSKLRYYISNIVITKADGSTFVQPESYYLIDLGTTSSLELNVPEVNGGEYTSVTFTLGVDSTRNVSGAQTGALSVSNEMFWSWNSGYIFLKAEGSCPQSATGDFIFHLGGFKDSNSTNAIQKITLDFGGDKMVVKEDATPVIHMAVNVKELFDGHHAINLTEMSDIHMPGMMAVNMAHNFSEAFSVEHVHN